MDKHEQRSVQRERFFRTTESRLLESGCLMTLHQVVRRRPKERRELIMEEIILETPA